MKIKYRILKRKMYVVNGGFIKVPFFLPLVLIFSAIVMSCNRSFDYDLQASDRDVNQMQNNRLNKNLTSNTLSIRTILAPQNINDVSGHFYVDSEIPPLNTPYMIVRWQDNSGHPGNAISHHVSYNPGEYTGFTPPSPRSDWQRGEFDDSISVSPVFQLQGTSGGIMMNSWFDTWKEIIGGGEGVTYGYDFSPYPKPWTTSSSRLWVQASLKLPLFANWDINQNGNAPVGQLNFVIYLHDISHHIAFAIVMGIFDNRSNPDSEHVSWDTHTYFVGAILGSTRYLTPNPYSQAWRMHTWNDAEFFRAEITTQNLINIVTDINNTYGTNLSYSPDDYVLTMAGIMQETFRENGDQVSMGSSFDGFGVYEAY